MEEQIFEIICHGGDARGYAYDALREGRKGNFEEASALLEMAEKELTLAHNTQTKLVQQELNGGNIKISLLMVHAQDQLMTAIAEKNLIEEMIEMNKALLNEIRK